MKSYIKQSKGNAVSRPTGGGVITHAVEGAAYPVMGSFNVWIEGEPALRANDLWTGNHMPGASMPANTPPTPLMGPMMAGAGPAPKESEKDANEGKDWLEIAIEDPEGNPVAGARYRVTTPKGKTMEGAMPTIGKVKIKRLAKGKCKVEWLDDVAEVGKAGSKEILAGSPAADNVTTGSSYKYVLKLEKVRIRVLDHAGEPCKNAKCDVWIRPFFKSRRSADGKGWLGLWCPPKAKQIEFRIVSPYEAERRRVYLRPLADDDKAASKQRLHNLGFFGASEPDEHPDMLIRAYGIEESDADLAKHLADIESHYKSADNPRDKRVQALTDTQHDLSDLGERT
jgi:Domain of unknown function (DUF4150)